MESPVGMRGYGVQIFNGERTSFPVEVSRRQVYARLGENVVWRTANGGKRQEGGFADGWSGTPIYSEAGEFLGAFSNNFWLGNRNSPGALTPAERIHDVLLRGRRTRPTRSERAAVGVDDPLQAGECVGIFWIWGDLHQGLFGVAAHCVGDEAVLLGHHFSGDFGATELEVQRANVIGYTYSDGAIGALIAEPAAHAGAAYWDSPSGVYVVCGDSPRAYCVHFELRADDEVFTRSYWIARLEHMREPGVALITRHALEDIEALPSARYEDRIRLYNNDTASELDGRDVTRLDAESLAVAVEEMANACLTTCDAIRVEITSHVLH